MHKLLLCGLLFLTAGGPALAGCFDVSKGEPERLTGLLTHRIFAGPPNFEDVQRGDTPEPGYVLTLDEDICLTGDADFADPAYRFDEVQLVETEETAKAMQELRDQRATVSLRDPMPAMTGHHHRPLVAWVTAIEPDDETADPTAGYGTAQTVVEAFYRALETGDGGLAAGFVIPEKTRTGPFSPKALSRFYGSLAEPLRLQSVKALGADRFAVRYTFTSTAGRCDGRATVTTTKREGRNYVRSIRADNGC